MPPNAFELLARLISFDTTSSLSNLALIDWVCDYLAPLGFRLHRIGNADGSKANLIASIGPPEPGGIVLSGHSDVVPVAGQDWSSPPFTLSERDGRLYGRGTADMKGFIAACLAAAPSWAAGGLRRPIHLALSYDEELGCLGAPSLVDVLRQSAYAPAIAIIGEPTDMQLTVAHKGVFAYSTRFRGAPAHSSQPHLGRNALEPGLAFARALFNLRDEMKRHVSGVSGLHPAVTTFNIGRLEAGTALNIVPESCALTWEYRPIPEADIALLEHRIALALQAAVAPPPNTCLSLYQVEHQRIATVPALRPEPVSEAEQLVAAVLGANSRQAVAFGTEAGLYQEAGISTVVCGPGSIAQAHQADEFISRDQFALGCWFAQQVGDWARRH